MISWKAAVFAFAVEEGLAGAQAAAHDLGHEETAAVDFVDEPLAHDVAQGVGEAFADLFLLVVGEEAEDAVDALAGVDRVQRAQDEVAGFGSRERDLHRLAVANFAEQNHLRRLPQGGAQAGGEIGKILP